MVKTEKKRFVRFTLQRKKALTGLMFVSPFIFGLVLLYIGAITESILFSFGKFDENLNNVLIGWGNYKTILFVDPNFVRDVVESVGSLLLNTTIVIIYAIFVSSLLNRNIKGKGIFRALLFLPVIISTGVISKIQSYDMLNMLSGIGGAGGDVSHVSNGLFQIDTIKDYIMSLNIVPQLSDVIASAIQNIYKIINRSGVQIIIFLAGLQSISPSIYEAAYVEGASGWETIWKITMPMLSPLILVNVVYTVIDSFTNASNPIIIKIYRYTMETIDFGLASAMAWIYFILILVILIIVFSILSKFVYYENR